MEICPDYEDLFRTLNAFRIKYLVVGAHAVIFHTEPRYTKDIDVWIAPQVNDAERVYQALKAFGAPLRGLKADAFKDQSLIYQMGIEPVRVDIITRIESVSFREAWKDRRRTLYGKTPIHVIGLNDLIRVKRKAGRPQDLLDLAKLTARRKRR